MMRVRGERDDDGGGKREIEHHHLHDAIVAWPEQSRPLDQIRSDDDEQKRYGFQYRGHASLFPVAIAEVWFRVREKGLEPSRQRHRNLNPARLPISPLARATRRNGWIYKTLGAEPRGMEPLDRIELSTCSLRVSRSTD